jgi:hypothetical protein
MPGLVPGIHVFAAAKMVDGRDRPGHDEFLIASGVLEPNRSSRVKRLSIFRAPSNCIPSLTSEDIMVITAAHITPIVALIAGILILIMPRLLNFIVAIYLIIVGLMGLNGIYHFFH